MILRREKEASLKHMLQSCEQLEETLREIDYIVDCVHDMCVKIENLHGEPTHKSGKTCHPEAVFGKRSGKTHF